MEKFSIGPDGTDERSPLRLSIPNTLGFGRSVSWQRTIAGQTFSFTKVDMPDGEIRWFVSRFNGYAGGPQFDCAWSPRYREWIFKP